MHQTEALLGILLALEADWPERGGVEDVNDQDNVDKMGSLTNILTTLRKVPSIHQVVRPHLTFSRTLLQEKF